MWISEAHIPGKDNIEADQQSTEWKLHPELFQKIVDKFGKPDIDLFASRKIDNQKAMCLGIQNQKPWQLMPSRLLGITNFGITKCSHLLVLKVEY